MEQYAQFRPEARFAEDVANDPACPANKVSFAAATQYCTWLNEEEGVPADELSYDDDYRPTKPGLSKSAIERTGYRLPTSVEWERACRAGTNTTYFSGNEERNLRGFAWYAQNSLEKLHKVGSLRPNGLGLFDMPGNVAEWCHSPEEERRFILRGGAYSDPVSKLGSAALYYQSANGFSYTGFRIACTLPAGE
jgi:formylglycine-generating enzyme required for sulfatase activity